MIPEPVEIKEEIRRMMGVMDEKLAVWYGNKLQSYIYKEVKGMIDWRSFLELMSKRTQELLRWVREEVKWEDLLRLIEEDLRKKERADLDSFLR
ncbi:MAG: hypothetical protein ACP5KE_02870 [Candidatus Methanodesulfokora sp.]|jgi:hypothetical protein|nr:MAG: hypothetical protein C0200_05410 [Candidatus Korarchaeota archaeon]